MTKTRIYFYQFVFCLVAAIIMGITAACLHPLRIFGMFVTLSTAFSIAMVFNYCFFQNEISLRKEER